MDFNALQQARNLFDEIKKRSQPLTQSVQKVINPTPIRHEQRQITPFRQRVQSFTPTKQGITQSINTLGRSIGSQPLIAPPSLPFQKRVGPNILQTAKKVTPLVGGKTNSPISSFLSGNVQAIPGQFKQIGQERAGIEKLAFETGRKRTLTPNEQTKVNDYLSASLPIGGVKQVGKKIGAKAVQTVTNPQSPFLNVNRLNIKPQAKQLVKDEIQSLKPQVEKVVGRKLSNKQIINQARQSSDLLKKTIGIDETEKYTGSLLAARQKLSQAAESGKVDQEFIDTLLLVKSHATNAGRTLQSLGIGADPVLKSNKSQVLNAVLKVEKDTDKILKAARNVDFNDERQATEFYRTFIKPTNEEFLDVLRYNSMLSSPNTHLVNVFSNALNTSVVAPLEKLTVAGVDFLASKKTGKPRTAFAGEAKEYARGYGEQLGNASERFANVLRGKQGFTNLDLQHIPLGTNTVKGKIATYGLSYPTRLLEATDQFFQQMTSGGEKAALMYRKGKGVKVGNIEAQAQKKAAYRLFRGEIGDKDQGTLLRAVDEVTNSIQRLRGSDNQLVSQVAKFTVPFLRTPTNILKQGIEYSPAGLATLRGASNRTEQLAKAIMGSTAIAATALLTNSGRTTFAEPTDPEQKAAFKAAGMQPYSVKIGDQWISYQKLPPAVAFNMSLVSALHDADRNKTLDDSQIDIILSGIAKNLNFFADQSYMKQVGELIASAKGDPEKMADLISNYPEQLIPYRALSGWIARTLDPYQRKVDPGKDWIAKQADLLKLQVPGLREQVSPRLDERGNPIENFNRFGNALSPVKTSTEQPEARERFDIRSTELQANTFIKPVKETIQRQNEELSTKITTDVFNKIVADNPNLPEEVKNELYTRLHSKISERTKKSITVANATKIKQTLDTMPKDKKSLRIYLMKMKAAGLLTPEVAQALLEGSKPSEY